MDPHRHCFFDLNQNLGHCLGSQMMRFQVKNGSVLRVCVCVQFAVMGNVTWTLRTVSPAPTIVASAPR